MNNALKRIIGLGLIPLLASCAPVAAVTSAMVGTTIAEERSSGTRMDDTLITIKIKEDFTQKEFNEMLSRISVTVHEGRVLLTGSVKNESFSQEAQAISWKVRGVKEVLNEIVIDDKDIRDYTKDSFIANSIRSKLLFKEDIRSVNYSVDVNEGVVYLLGIAQNQKEIDDVLDISRSVKGVVKVVNFVIFKDDQRRIQAGQFLPK